MVQANCTAQARCKLSKLWSMLFACQILDHADNLKVLRITAHLQERVLLLCCTTSVVFHCLLSHGERFEFLTAAGGLCFKVLGLGHAILMQAAQCVDILVQVFGGDAK